MAFFPSRNLVATVLVLCLEPFLISNARVQNGDLDQDRVHTHVTSRESILPSLPIAKLPVGSTPRIVVIYLFMNKQK